jgi:hypothetical protein
MANKIKILYLAANPTDTGHLRLQEEARELEARIRLGLYRETFEVTHYLAVRLPDLLRGLQELQPHVLHFSGHGSFDNKIVFQAEDGTSQPIPPDDFAELVQFFQANLKLVMLSCCFGRNQAKALNDVVDFTIGMENPISDSGAVSFSANFYQVLASGGSINQAFGAARLVTNMEGRKVFGTSDLLIREGANPNDPFINLLPQTTADVPIVSDRPQIGPGSQVITGGSKVGLAALVNGPHSTNNFTVNPNEK